MGTWHPNDVEGLQVAIRSSTSHLYD